MLSWQVGAVKVTRVVEMELPVKAGAEFFMPQATPQELRKSPWLYPNFVSEDEIMQMSIHALLVEAPGLRLVVDTCIGNDKPRSLLRGGSLSTDFLKDLEAVGWTRESVDAVVCTHLHVDHVGWNTMLRGRQVGPDLPQRPLLDRPDRIRALGAPTPPATSRRSSTTPSRRSSTPVWPSSSSSTTASRREIRLIPIHRPHAGPRLA